MQVPSLVVGVPAVPALSWHGVATEVLSEIVPPLPKAKPSRIAVIGCGVKIHFPWSLACERYGKAVNAVRQAIDEEAFEIVRAPEPFEDPEALLRFLDDELPKGVAGVILFHAAYTAGEIGSYLGRWLADHAVPLLSWSFPDPAGGNLTANSLCCQNFLLGMFARLGARYAWVHHPLERGCPPAVGRFARSVRARERFRFGKVLHMGGSHVPAFYDGETDELAVMRRFGLRFDRVDHEAIFQHARKWSDATLKRLRDAIVESPRCARNDVPDTQIFQTLRIGLSILDLAHERGYLGCTIKSWPELFDQYGCACDGTVSMLNDFGFCTTEEGEMNGLLSSLALHLLSEGAAIPTLMDLSGVDAERNRIAIWHCGACPTRILKEGASFEARKHSILENANPETAVGLMVEFLLALGDATVVRYQSPDAARMFAFEGELVDCPLAFRGNYCEMVPKAPATASAVMGSILGRGLDHHWSLGYGHWIDDLRMLNHWLGIGEVLLSHGGGLDELSQFSL